ncbi:hypothetical protein KKC87_04490 [Patescibacteria group bacterium]|nr:hypothetical protein [Patescibacteria group bacterium]
MSKQIPKKFRDSKRGDTPHELLLFYAIGLEPKHMIIMGYGRSTVYRYKAFFEKAKEKAIKKLGGFKWQEKNYSQ